MLTQKEIFDKQIMTLSFPLVAVPQARPRFSTKNGVIRAVDDAKCRNFKEKIKSLARERIEEKGYKIFPQSIPLTLSVTLWLPIPASWSKNKKYAARRGYIYPMARPDLDNYLKAVSDALIGVAYVDDSNIVEIVCSKRYVDDFFPTNTPTIWATIQKTGF